MFKSKKKKAQEEQRKALDEQIVEIATQVKAMKVEDPKYPTYVAVLAQLYKIQEDMDESKARVAKDYSGVFEKGVKALGVIGTLVITGVVAERAYSIDCSDEIPRNKQSMRLSDKLVPPKMLGGGGKD